MTSVSTARASNGSARAGDAGTPIPDHILCSKRAVPSSPNNASSKRRRATTGVHAKREAARLLLVNDRDECLLMRERRKGEVAFCMPGGKAESGEDSRACAIREAREETADRISQTTCDAIRRGDLELQTYCQQTHTSIFVVHTQNQEDLELPNWPENAFPGDVLGFAWIARENLRQPAWRTSNLHTHCHIEMSTSLKTWLFELRECAPALTEKKTGGLLAAHYLECEHSSASVNTISLSQTRMKSLSSASLHSAGSSTATGRTSIVERLRLSRHVSLASTPRPDAKLTSDQNSVCDDEEDPHVAFTLAEEESNASTTPTTPTLSSPAERPPAERPPAERPPAERSLSSAVDTFVEVPVVKIPTKYQELYHSDRLEIAIRMLSKNAIERQARIRVLEKTLKDANDKRGADVSRLLHRIRRVEDTYEYAKALARNCTIGTVDGLRCHMLEVHYTRKTFNAFKMEYGRLYGHSHFPSVPRTDGNPAEHSRKLCLQGAPRELRAWICNAELSSIGYWDIDMVNAFPTLAVHLAIMHGLARKDFPSLATYVSNETSREEVLKEIMNTHRVDSRDLAKRLPITMLHGGSYECWLRDVRAPIANVRVPFMMSFFRDVTKVGRVILASNSPIEQGIHANRQEIIQKGKSDARVPSGGLTPCERTSFSYILQTYEDRVLAMIVDSLVKDKWQVGSLQYDGVYVRHVGGNAQHAVRKLEESIRRAEDHVSQMTGGRLKVTLKRKAMESSKVIAAEWQTVHLQMIPLCH